MFCMQNNSVLRDGVCLHMAAGCHEIRSQNRVSVLFSKMQDYIELYPYPECRWMKVRVGGDRPQMRSESDRSEP